MTEVSLSQTVYKVAETGNIEVKYLKIVLVQCLSPWIEGESQPRIDPINFSCGYEGIKKQGCYLYLHIGYRHGQIMKQLASGHRHVKGPFIPPTSQQDTQSLCSHFVFIRACLCLFMVILMSLCSHFASLYWFCITVRLMFLLVILSTGQEMLTVTSYRGSSPGTRALNLYLAGLFSSLASLFSALLLYDHFIIALCITLMLRTYQFPFTTLVQSALSREWAIYKNTVMSSIYPLKAQMSQ